MLTKTALTKVLIPVVADETSAATAAEPILALAVAAAAVAQEEAVTVSSNPPLASDFAWHFRW